MIDGFAKKRSQTDNKIAVKANFETRTDKNKKISIPSTGRYPDTIADGIIDRQKHTHR